MPDRSLGNSVAYHARRRGGVTTFSASGMATNLSQTYEFVPMPFFIQPPMIAFVVTTPDIVLPTTRPFLHEQIVPYPASATTARILDADGVHIIDVVEEHIVPFEEEALPDPGEKAWCVHRQIGATRMMIAPCDRAVPAFFQRVFGPETLPACEAHVATHGGVTE